LRSDAAITEVGVALTVDPPLEEYDADWKIEVVEPFEVEPTVDDVMARAVAYATVDALTVTTSFDERLGMALPVAASLAELKVLIREYMHASGWWAVLVEHLRLEARVDASVAELDHLLGPIHVAPDLQPLIGTPARF
jgi:hypothetical protein